MSAAAHPHPAARAARPDPTARAALAETYR